MRRALAVTLLIAAICTLRPTSAFAQIEEVRIDVEGLTCNLCAVSLERSLRKVASVSSVQVSMEEETALVKLKSGARFDADTLRSAVHDSGQEALEFQLRLSATVRGEDGRYTLVPGDGTLLAVGSSSTPKIAAHVGKVVRVRARVASAARAPIELELTDVVAR